MIIYLKNKMEIEKSLIQSLHKAIEIKDTKIQAEIQLKLAQEYYNQNKFQDAKAHLLQIQKIYSKYPNVNYYLGLVELNLQNDVIAIKYFKSELAINPNHDFAKQILKNFEIKSTFPFTTIILLLISLLTYFIAPLNYDTLLKFGASNFNLTIFSLYTSIFFHANIVHLLFNSVFLLMFGFYLEKYIGNLKFLSIFLFGGIIGNLFQVLFTLDGIVIGMSSGIFAIFGALVAKEPLLDFKIFGLIKVPLIILFGLVFIMQYYISTLLNIQSLLLGEIAHLFGFITGLFILVIYNRDLIFIFYNWLTISTGFVLLAYSLKNLYTNMLISNLTSVTSYMFLFIFSFLIITYAYYKLKFDILIHKSSEGNN
jgi:membrane associated rhomboid family serine protease